MLFEPASRTKQVEQNASARPTHGREKSQAGETVTPEIALTVSAVLAAFTILSEDISSLPLILYRRNGRNKERDYGSPYYRLMHDKPNPEHSSMIFRELVVGHLLAWGNFFGQMIYNSAGDVTEIWPLRPDRMTVVRVNGERLYTYIGGDGKPRRFAPDQILHIPAFGFDGLVGYSRISLARNAIGLSLATEQYGSKFFANGARPGIALLHPGKLSDTAYNHLRDSWNEQHQGAEKSQGLAIMEEGMDLKTISIPPEDAQFLETRRFQVNEIARIFRVPPHMIGDMERSTSWGSGIDSQEQGYVNHTLRPWLVRIEQSLNTQLLLEKQQETQYFEHLLDGLLRGDLTARYGAYVQAINNGIMSPNEVRDRENLNPYDGGDEYYHPLNMATQGKAPAARQNFEPLYRDAVTRVVKREMNDLRGAVRRSLARGKSAEFESWAAQFYRQDHPDFINRQFLPILTAQGRAPLDSGLESIFENYIQTRLDSLSGKTAEELENAIDGWLEAVPETLLTAIRAEAQ